MADASSSVLPQLRQVEPIDTGWLEDRVRLTTLEVWDSHVRLQIAQVNSAPAEAEDAGLQVHIGLMIEDDAGTAYRCGKSTLGSCSSHHLLDHGSIEFAPGPPAGARLIRVLDELGRELITVPLV